MTGQMIWFALSFRSPTPCFFPLIGGEMEGVISPESEVLARQRERIGRRRGVRCATLLGWQVDTTDFRRFPGTNAMRDELGIDCGGESRSPVDADVLAGVMVK